MPLWPDILVTKPDSPEMQLVVAVKARGIDEDRTEVELKAYMAQLSCPVGMFVTPEQTRFYRNRYTDYGPQAIEMIGECPTAALLGGLAGTPVSESYLEQRVLQWLERLQAGASQSWPPSVREAVDSSVLPVVLGGVIQSGGPRLRKTGS
jgi:hypothetical protein